MPEPSRDCVGGLAAIFANAGDRPVRIKQYAAILDDTWDQRKALLRHLADRPRSQALGVLLQPLQVE